MLTTKEKIRITLEEYTILFLTLNYFVIRKIIKRELNFKKNEKILDMGCGTGILSRLFFKKNYIGIDFNKKLVHFAKQKYQYDFRFMDATKLDFPKDFFDKIIVSGVTHHVNDEDFKKICQCIKKVLKNNGKVLIIEAIPPLSRLNFLGYFFRSRDKGKYIRNLNGYKNTLSKYFKIIKAYSKRGGIFDYAIFLVQNKNIYQTATGYSIE